MNREAPSVSPVEDADIAYEACALATRPFSGKVLLVAAHPSDTADFYAPFALQLQAADTVVLPVVLTRGEAGDAPNPPRQTMDTRWHEERQAAEILGLPFTYLTTRDVERYDRSVFLDDGCHFPDGALLDHLPLLTARMEALILRERPEHIVIPSFHPDHPDHVAAAIATVVALHHLRESFEQGLLPRPALYTVGPEFGMAVGQPWAVETIRAFCETMQGSGPDDALYRTFLMGGNPYRYVEDEATGRLYPAPDFLDRDYQSVDHDIAVPGFLYPIPDETMRTAMEALLQSDTQVGEDKGEKAYDYAIPMVYRMRGAQIGETWAGELNPVRLPGITDDSLAMIAALSGGNAHQLRYLHRHAMAGFGTYREVGG